MSRFEKIFRSKKCKNGFVGLKSLKKFFRCKKDVLLGLKKISRSKKSKKRIFRCKRVKNIWGSRKIFDGVKIFGVPKKFGGFLNKKEGRQKNLGKYGQKKATLDISWRYMD